MLYRRSEDSEFIGVGEEVGGHRPLRGRECGGSRTQQLVARRESRGDALCDVKTADTLARRAPHAAAAPQRRPAARAAQRSRQLERRIRTELSVDTLRQLRVRQAEQLSQQQLCRCHPMLEVEPGLRCQRRHPRIPLCLPASVKRAHHPMMTLPERHGKAPMPVITGHL